MFQDDLRPFGPYRVDSQGQLHPQEFASVVYKLQEVAVVEGSAFYFGLFVGGEVQLV